MRPLAKLVLGITLVWDGGTVYGSSDETWRPILEEAFVVGVAALVGWWVVSYFGTPRWLSVVLMIFFPLGLLIPLWRKIYQRKRRTRA